MTARSHNEINGIEKLPAHFTLDKVPNEERQKKWYFSLKHIIANFLDRDFPEKTNFIKTLFDPEHSNWKRLKETIEWAQENLANWEQILGISSRIPNAPNPDIIVEAALAEIKAARYLNLRHFHDIKFNKTGIDFEAKFNKELWYFEITLISGEDFKTQTAIYPPLDPSISPVYGLNSHKLINILKSKYETEKEQFSKHKRETENCAILFITYLLETYEPWLSNEELDGKHPIEKFIHSCDIPTVVIGAGTIYEPVAPFVVGKFPIDQLWIPPYASSNM
jgi:hypothetical protein